MFHEMQLNIKKCFTEDWQWFILSKMWDVIKVNLKLFTTIADFVILNTISSLQNDNLVADIYLATKETPQYKIES